MATNRNVTIEDREVHRMINGLIRKINNPKPLLINIGRYTRALTQKMLNDNQPRPDNISVRGKKWRKLAQSTIWEKRRLYRKGKSVALDRPLVRTGRLRDSLNSERAIQIKGKGLIYGTNVRSRKGFYYPGFHQVGGRTRHGRVPARPFLFLQRSELHEIANMTRNYILDRMSRIR